MLALVAAAAGCGEPAAPAGPAIDEVRIVSSRWPAAPGDSVVFTAWAVDSTGATLETPAARFYSADTSLLTVDSGGRALARRAGKVAVHAAILGVETFMYESILVAVDSIAVRLGAPGAVVGDTLPVAATIFDSSGAVLEPRVTEWLSANSAVARFVEPGLLLTVAPGAVAITVRREGHSATETLTVGVPRFLAVAAGADHTCALATDRRAWCWGAGGEGRLGTGGTEWTALPRQVRTSLVFDSLAAGAGDACGLTAAGTVYCWGNNSNGRLGDGTTAHRLVPVPVSASVSFRALAMGGAQTCAITTSNTAYCWGYNSRGQLGLGDTVDRAVPSAVASLGTAGTVATGAQGDYGYVNSCVRRLDGTIWCVGSNNVGQLGNGGRSASPVLAPVQTSAGGPWITVATGGEHSCALQSDGQAWCWGENWRGQLGRPTVYNEPFDSVPKPITSPVRFTTIAAGQFHNCALTAAGAAWCWGIVGSVLAGGPISDGSVNAVAGGNVFTAITSGDGHSCAIAADGAYCWGENNVGQLGTRGASTMTPRKVAGQP